MNTACNRVKGHKQKHKGEIGGENGAKKLLHGGVQAKPYKERDDEEGAPKKGYLAVVFFPKKRVYQRPEGYGKKKTHKGNSPKK